MIHPAVVMHLAAVRCGTFSGTVWLPTASKQRHRQSPVVLPSGTMHVRTIVGRGNPSVPPGNGSGSHRAHIQQTGSYGGTFEYRRDQAPRAYTFNILHMQYICMNLRAGKSSEGTTGQTLCNAMQNYKRTYPPFSSPSKPLLLHRFRQSCPRKLQALCQPLPWHSSCPSSCPLLS